MQKYLHINKSVSSRGMCASVSARAHAPVSVSVFVRENVAQ